MQKHLISLVLISTLIGSCAPAPASSPLPVTATVTQTVIPSETPLPTQTVIPTATPYPPLQTDAPYLLFTYDNKNFTIMDADGSGRKQFQLPNDGYIWELEKAVSPDRKWLAYFTGSGEEPYDLALNILDIKNGSTFLIINLIGHGYPDNLKNVTVGTYYDPDNECSNDIECLLVIIQSDFRLGLVSSLDWSPDSKELAFAAQIDGPSSDVYIFDINQMSYRRVVADKENVGKILWSPDGKKLLYESRISSYSYGTGYIYIADPSSYIIQFPDAIYGGTFWSIGGWIDDNLILIFDSGDGGAPHNLQYLDTETQRTKTIWENELELFATNPELHGMVFALLPEMVEYFQLKFDPGTYFVSVDGIPKKLSNEVYLPVYNQLNIANSFFANKDRDLYTINVKDLAVQLIKENVDFDHSPRLSPNKKWLLVEGYDGLQLFTENLELLKSWEIRNSELIWRSDSEGVVLVTAKEIYYLSIPDGELKLIEDCAPDYCPIRYYTWLP